MLQACLRDVSGSSKGCFFVFYRRLELNNCLRVDFEENFFEKNCLFFCFKVFTDHTNGTTASKMCFSQKQDKAVFSATKSRFRSFDITNAERNPKGVNHSRDFAVALSDH